MKKIFVGTMYSGEGDAAASQASVECQEGVEIEHLIIRHLPEREAHNQLWDAWRARQSSFYAFLKVDADTVLYGPNIIAEFVKLMESNPRITGIQAPLDDFFTGGLINGLNFFSSRVTFQDTRDDLFCDRNVDVGHDLVIKADGVPTTLVPAGLHCHLTSDIQAFHFGLHRKLKNQHHIIDAVRRAHEKDNQRGRALALLGAKYASEFERDRSFNYTDKKLIEVFERAKFEL